MQMVRAQMLGRLEHRDELEILSAHERCLVLFEPESAVEDLTRQRGVESLRSGLRRFSATEPSAPVALVVSGKASDRVRDRIRVAQGYLGAWRFSELDLEDLAPRLGIYYYNHDWSGAGPGAYARVTAPDGAHALEAEALPPDLRAQLESVRLPRVSFAATEALHLADHGVEAHTWGDQPLREDLGAYDGEGHGEGNPGDPYRSDPASEPPPSRSKRAPSTSGRTVALLVGIVVIGILIALIVAR
jgi:hypothetical protein